MNTAVAKAAMSSKVEAGRVDGPECVDGEKYFIDYDSAKGFGAAIRLRGVASGRGTVRERRARV